MKLTAFKIQIRHVFYQVVFVMLLSSYFILFSPTASHASMVGTSPLGPSNLSVGLLARWTFDGADINWSTGRVNDASGNNKVAFLINVATSTSVQAGKYGQSLRFNGTNARIITQYVASVASDFTISFWEKPADIANARFMYDAINSGANRFYMQHLSASSGGQVQFGLSSWNPIFNNAATLNTWSYYTVTLSGTTGRVYRNGVLLGSQSGITLSAPNASLRLGSDENPSSFLSGNLDDFRVYGRALSAAEITQLYQLGSASKVNTSTTFGAPFNLGMTGWWTFDGTDISWATARMSDMSANGRTATLVNFSTTTSIVIGKRAQALRFNGSNSYVVAGSDPIGTGDASGCAWLNPATVSNSANIFNNSQLVLLFSTNNRLTISSNNSTFVLTSVNAVNPNVWQFVCFTRRSTGAASIYVNGTAFMTSQSSGTPGAGGTMRFGTNPTASSGFYSGIMDDVRFYNRILTQADIQELYALGKNGARVSTTQTGPGNLNTGLVGWWTFDGPTMRTNVGDSSGQGNNGALLGFGATSSAVVAGKMGQALQFDGSSNSIYAGTSASTDLVSTMTISAWVYPRNLANFPSLIGKRNSTNNWPFVLILTASNQLQLYSDAGSALNVISDASLPLNKWTYITVTRSGTTITFYFNGVPQSGGTLTLAQGSSAPSALLCLGSQSIGGSLCNSNLFNGLLDDVRLYNRALSSAEVKQLYNSGR